MTTFLPLDSTGNAIPALRLKNGAAHAIAATAASTRNTAAFDSTTRIISLYATIPVYLRTGDSAVTATSSDHYFPAGVYYDISIGGGNARHATHIAVLRVGSENGTVYVSDKE